MDIIQLASIRILSYPYRKLCVFHIAPDLEQNHYIFQKHFLKVTHLSVVTQIILEEKKPSMAGVVHTFLYTYCIMFRNIIHWMQCMQTYKIYL